MSFIFASSVFGSDYFAALPHIYTHRIVRDFAPALKGLHILRYCNVTSIHVLMSYHSMRLALELYGTYLDYHSCTSYEGMRLTTYAEMHHAGPRVKYTNTV